MSRVAAVEHKARAGNALRRVGKENEAGCGDDFL